VSVSEHPSRDHLYRCFLSSLAPLFFCRYSHLHLFYLLSNVYAPYNIPLSSAAATEKNPSALHAFETPRRSFVHDTKLGSDDSIGIINCYNPPHNTSTTGKFSISRILQTFSNNLLFLSPYGFQLISYLFSIILKFPARTSPLIPRRHFVPTVVLSHIHLIIYVR